ncbi:MAG TPA: hypothetical protein VLF62_02090, partial [Candidatus Saccharimonadales bacterium]|nr:hypothetical protein [Candidatus Saccharimonadales bacterium]
MTFTGGEQPSARPPQFPFEQAYHDIPNLAETMHFNGRVYDILGQMATTQAAQHGTEHFWQPARLVRAVVDSKVGGYERVGLLRAVTDYAVDAYTATPTTSQYGDVVSRLVDHGLLGK